MIETLRDFVEKANKLGLEYMITGSYAMSAYGEIRMTRDIDIVIQLREEMLTKFVGAFDEGYDISKDSVLRAIRSRSMFNIINQTHGGKIDCIIQKDTAFAQESFSRRFKVSVAKIEFWTTTKEDLVLAKLLWAKDAFSEMQIRDIANLTESEYDSDYVTKWIAKMDLAGIWAEVEQWKIRRDKAGI
ncbi:MAG: hypothetical protein K1X36_09610 [Pyrinomonadaceae bacterium]|nr:hypothetical protein [Pyrinomonadaceae bacterium]